VHFGSLLFVPDPILKKQSCIGGLRGYQHTGLKRRCELNGEVTESVYILTTFFANIIFPVGWNFCIEMTVSVMAALGQV
jgi:hypothetical protein